MFMSRESKPNGSAACCCCSFGFAQVRGWRCNVLLLWLCTARWLSACFRMLCFSIFVCGDVLVLRYFAALCCVGWQSAGTAHALGHCQVRIAVHSAGLCVAVSLQCRIFTVASQVCSALCWATLQFACIAAVWIVVGSPVLCGCRCGCISIWTQSSDRYRLCISYVMIGWQSCVLSLEWLLCQT
jgi:hypothetical protein